MKPKNSLKKTFLIIVFIGVIIISPVFLSYFISKSINLSAENHVQSVAIFPIANASSIAKLNLINCEGAWDKISKSYSKWLVIFTDKEESQ